MTLTCQMKEQGSLRASSSTQSWRPEFDRPIDHEVAAWTSDVLRMADEWQSLAAVAPSRSEVALWEREVQHLVGQVTELRQKKLWLSGPADLLGVAGVAHAELVHSRIVAWLLSPDGRHGLEDRLLRYVLAEQWPEPPSGTIDARVDCEVVWGPRRADIVVTFGPTTLVIENKVWSPESEDQCKDLYDLWSGRSADMRFLFLSPDGRRPATAGDSDAAWRTLSYHDIASWLEATIDEMPNAVARVAIVAYAASVRASIAPNRWIGKVSHGESR